MSPKTHRMQQIPHSHAQRWLLAHDIRDKKRLQRVWRYLRQEGVRLQYSVYLLAGSRQQIEGIIERLRELIDERADDVRIYPLTENTRIWGLGTQFNDDGNTLCDDFMDKLRAVDHDTEPSTAEDDKRLNFS
jgi:CRISPR-associated protein Cas2